MKNNQNPPEYFPEFNEYHLRYYATEWIKHHKNTPAIESIILYRCHAVYQHLLYEESLKNPDWPMKAPTKYALVFNIVVPPIFKQTKEHYGLKSENYSNCEICKIMDIENYRKFLIDIGYNDDPRWDTPLKVFLDSTFQEIVYRRPPKHNFRDDWKLQAKHPNEEFYRHIVVDGPKWTLYDDSWLQLNKDKKEISKKNIPSVDIQDETVEESPDDFIDKNEISEKQYIFQQTGPTWHIKYDGNDLFGLKGKGFGYIHFLVKHKPKEYHTDELAIEVDKISDPDILDKLKQYPNKRTDNNDYDNKKKKSADHRDMVDGKSKIEIKEHWKYLKQEHDKAIYDNDPMRIDKTRKELETFEDDYFKLVRPGGKSRQFIDDTKKNQDRISKNIKRALEKIKKYDKLTWQHFKSALDPIHAYYLSYTPDRNINWLTD
jgi:hypothetical protein